MKDTSVQTNRNLQVWSRKTVLEIAEFLEDAKARNIVVLDMRECTGISDYFVLCTVNSTVQSRAIVRDLDAFMDEHDVKPISGHVSTDSPWVLLDYNYFIIHIFLEEGRSFYQLEKLWSDAKVVYSKGGIL
jgi:ribosome-associated protein